MALLLPVREGVLRLEPGEQQSLDSLLRVLRAEAGPISTWMHVAQHLLAAGRDSDYEAVMSEVVDRQAAGGDTFSQVLAFCSLAEFTAQRAAADRDRRSRALLLSRSTELCHKAQRLSTGAQEQLPELVLANVALIKVGAAWVPTGRDNVACRRKPRASFCSSHENALSSAAASCRALSYRCDGWPPAGRHRGCQEGVGERGAHALQRPTQHRGPAGARQPAVQPAQLCRGAAPVSERARSSGHGGYLQLPTSRNK